MTAASRISTHAPRTGSDAFAVIWEEVEEVFQPTLPARGATHLPLALGHADFPFQPTLPARGATTPQAHPFRRKQISTHAPRTGSDLLENAQKELDKKFQPTLPARGATTLRRQRKPQRDFNPRSPHGERPRLVCPHHFAQQFQPTLPARGATSSSSVGITSA